MQSNAPEPGPLYLQTHTLSFLSCIKVTFACKKSNFLCFSKSGLIYNGCPFALSKIKLATFCSNGIFYVCGKIERSVVCSRVVTQREVICVDNFLLLYTVYISGRYICTCNCPCKIFYGCIKIERSVICSLLYTISFAVRVPLGYTCTNGAGSNNLALKIHLLPYMIKTAYITVTLATWGS